MKVRLHIERLVVDGLDLAPHEAETLRTVLQGRLGALWGGPGAPPRVGTSLQVIETPAVTTPRRADGALLGRAVADGLQAGLATPASSDSPSGVGETRTWP